MKATITDIESRLIIKEDRTQGILGYDIDNAYPQRIHDIVSNSGTARSCLKIYRRFIIGGGMADADFYKAKVNRKGLTVDKLLRKIANDKGEFDGIALHVNYNQLGEIIEVNHVKFGDVRISEEQTHAVVYEDWGKRRWKSVKRDRFQEIDWFNPDIDVITAQAEAAGGWDKYRGQIYYWTECGLEYPVASYDAVLEDMQTEGQMKVFRFRAASQNFLASHIIVTDKAAQDPGPIEGGGKEEDPGEAFANTIRQFQGSENTASILIVEKTSPSETFEVVKLDLQNYDGMHEKTETSVKDNIVESFLVPKPLLLRGSSSIGTSKEIEDSKEYYNDITADDRLAIEEIFREVFSRFAFKINPSDDYSILPIKVKKEIDAVYFPFVTKNQILASIDLPEVDDAVAEKKLPVETLGVGGLQALSALLQDTTQDNTQKLGQLQVIYGFSEAESMKILGITSQTRVA